MHDIHFHTSLSACAGERSDFADYIAAIPGNKLDCAGFSDHLWDHAVPGASPWYRPQDVRHVSQLKQRIRECRLPGTELFFGCECEYIGNGVISLHRDHAELFDFVLVSANHFHMTPLVRPPEINGGRKLAELFCTRFKEVCEIDFVTAIVHPFFPIGFNDRRKEVLQLFNEKELAACFELARSCGKSIELNISCLMAAQKDGSLADYLQILTVARDCGCTFHIGSDAHTVDNFTPAHFAFAGDLAAQNGFTVRCPLTGK